MESGKYEYQSDFAKKYYGQGRADGEAKGRSEGEAKGRIAAIFALLEARSVAVPAEARERIRACRDLAQLDRWVVRASTAGTVDLLFADQPS